eukprot:g11990.t1
MTNPAAILVQLEGVDYTLQSISFKSPSEHTVQGAHNAMEVQLYHTGKDFQGAERRLLVSVSLAQREDAWNKFLDPIFNAMPQDGAGTPSIMISNPWSDLAPPDCSRVLWRTGLLSLTMAVLRHLRARPPRGLCLCSQGSLGCGSLNSFALGLAAISHPDLLQQTVLDPLDCQIFGTVVGDTTAATLKP